MTIQPDQTIDITAEVCPMTFVRTKLRLERMKPGEILSVRLSGEEPLRNVPRAAREEGHSILSIEDAGDAHIVIIRRACSPIHQMRVRRMTTPSAAGPWPR
jgi:TusA-related sulfurtransferase